MKFIGSNRPQVCCLLIVASFTSGCSESDFSANAGRYKAAPMASSSGPPVGQQGDVKPSSNPADCNDNAKVVDATVKFKTPLSVPYQTGDMGINVPEDARTGLGKFQGKVLRESWRVAHMPTAPADTSSAPVYTGINKNDRDGVCKLYGYDRATDNDQFGYYVKGNVYSDNNVIVVFIPSTNTFNGEWLGVEAREQQPRLIWTQCQGKLTDACRNKFMKEQLSFTQTVGGINHTGQVTPVR